jgi:serine/threonine protein kinase
MESTGDEGAANRAKLLARLVNDVRAARAAGKSADDELIISAHPELMPELREELQKLAKPQVGRSTRVARSDSFPMDPSATRLPGSDAPIANVPSVEVPGYNILKELGRGGQAVVFLALQLSTGRKVAVKVTYEGALADERSQARFNREVRALAALQHPNIVAILDTGRTADGNRYIAMDYIAGCSLDEYMKYRHKKDPADPSKLLRMFLKICGAMNVAHSQSIIHRDLKPTNIRVDERGEPHILDFGLARSAMDRFISGSSQPVSITGEFLGSIPWSSPEQAEGNPDKIDVRTDVYSLGVILYQMITGGHFPYEVVGNIRDVLNNILTAAPTPPSKAARQFLSKQPRAPQALPRHGASAVNEALEKVVLKALAKKPEQRYQSAGELGRDIANYLSGEKTSMREGALKTDPGKPAGRRNRFLIPTIGVMAIIAACAAGYGGWRYWHTKPAPISAAPAPVAEVSASLAPSAPASVVPNPAPAPPAKITFDSESLQPMVLHGRCRLNGEDLCLTPIGPAEAMFLIGSLKWSDYDLTFRAITNSEGSFNVIFHWIAPGTYYGFCPASPNNRFADLFKRVDKGLPERAPGQLRFGRLEPDRWYDIHVEVRGSFYHCFVNGKEWFQTQDENFTHGKIGVGVSNPNVRFRDIKVTAPDGTVMWSGPPNLSGLPRFAQDRTNLPVAPLAKVDLLAQVDPARDSLAGNWTISQGSLISPAGASAQIEFPYSPAADYDYRVVLSRAAGESPIALIFPVGGEICDWVASGQKPTITGFASVDWKSFDSNHTTNHYVRMPLENNERHIMVVAVRGHLVTAYIDGLQMGSLRTDEDHVTLDPSIAPPRGNRLGLRIGGDAVTVESADVLPVTVETTRTAAVTRAPATEPTAN